MLLVLGLGMGLTMAPATESVMGSLPLAKAERRLGRQRRHPHDGRRARRRGARIAALERLPCGHGRRHAGPPAARPRTRPASRSRGALAVAQRIGGGAGGRVAEAAQQAFVDGMHTAVLAGAGIAALGALLALVALPARARAASRGAGAGVTAIERRPARDGPRSERSHLAIVAGDARAARRGRLPAR